MDSHQCAHPEAKGLHTCEGISQRITNELLEQYKQRAQTAQTVHNCPHCRCSCPTCGRPYANNRSLSPQQAGPSLLHRWDK
jgi:hypothetical protein